MTRQVLQRLRLVAKLTKEMQQAKMQKTPENGYAPCDCGTMLSKYFRETPRLKLKHENCGDHKVHFHPFDSLAHTN